MRAPGSVLVVGATGQVGGEVAVQLRRRDSPVRALVRGDPARPAAAVLSQSGAELVVGDLRDEAALRLSCAGVDTVVCTATAMPAAAGDALQHIDHDGVLSLIGAAEEAGVRRFVYTSYSGGIRTDSPLARAKRSCEARVASSGRMEFVVLRPSCFMEVWLGPHLGVDVQQRRARIFGDGTATVSYVSATDVAGFAVAAATRAGEVREVVEIGGPEPVSQLAAVELFERLSGSAFQREHVPLAALQQQHRSPDPLQQTFAALMIACASGDPIPDAAATAARYGVRLTSLEEFVRKSLASALR